MTTEHVPDDYTGCGKLLKGFRATGTDLLTVYCDRPLGHGGRHRVTVDYTDDWVTAQGATVREEGRRPHRMSIRDDRRDGLREAVTALCDEWWAKSQRDDTVIRDAGIMQAICDDLSRILDTVPDVPPDPPAVDRDWLAHWATVWANPKMPKEPTVDDYKVADALLASGVLLDAAEVRARTLEAAADLRTELRDYIERRGKSGYYDALWRKGEILDDLASLLEGKTAAEVMNPGFEATARRLRDRAASERDRRTT